MSNLSNFPKGCGPDDYEEWAGLTIRVDEEDRWHCEPSNIRRHCECGNLLHPESLTLDCEECEEEIRLERSSK